MLLFALWNKHVDDNVQLQRYLSQCFIMHMLTNYCRKTMPVFEINVPGCGIVCFKLHVTMFWSVLQWTGYGVFARGFPLCYLINVKCSNCIQSQTVFTLNITIWQYLYYIAYKLLLFRSIGVDLVSGVIIQYHIRLL